MFNEMLKSVMQQKSLIGADISAATGISQSSISQYLSGKIVPPDKKKEQIALALGLEADYFIEPPLEPIAKFEDETEPQTDTEIAEVISGVDDDSVEWSFGDSFADRLQYVMNKRNVDSDTLASIMGITTTTMGDYLSGKKKASIAKKEQFSIALGVPFNYFYGISPKVIPLKRTTRLNLPIPIAAMLMGKTSSFVRKGLQDQVFPWGYAVKMREQWSYYISPAKFMECTGCEIPDALLNEMEQSGEDYD